MAAMALCLAVGAGSAGATTFDLQNLPSYRPAGQVTGVVRTAGISLGGVMRVWEQGFQAFQPKVRFEDGYSGPDLAIAGLVSGVSDLGARDRDPTLVESLMFFETFGYPAASVTVASAAYGVSGIANGLVILVNANNPIAQLSLPQLDGIFGAERTGTLVGFKWTLGNGRDARGDLRTWDQLGLTGRWAGRPIHAYGEAPSGAADFFQSRVLKGSDKWSPTYRQYPVAAPAAGGDATAESLQTIAQQVAHDPDGIAWTEASQVRRAPGVKVVAIAATDAGPFVAPSAGSFRDRSYPLTRDIALYFKRAPGKALAPPLAEFLRYVLSRDGQAALEKSGTFLPLTAALADAQRQKLE